MGKSFFTTPAALAEELGVDPSKVLAWIHAGELVAINIAESTSTRPRFRIAQAAAEDFLRRRQTRPPVKSVPRRRKSRREVIEFFK